MSTLYLVGIGPGNRGEITEDAIKSLEDSDIIMGYAKYIELIEKFIDNKNVAQAYGAEIVHKGDTKK